jgi:hypothetical protein
MWTAVLFFGVGLALDPLRLGLVAIMLSRQRPVPNLVAFWLGGMVAGVGVGLTVLILFRGVALTAVEHMTTALSDLRSSTVILAGGGLQITMGVLLLLVLGTVLARQRVRVGMGVGVDADEASAALMQPRPPNIFTKIAAHSQEMLRRGVWPAFLVGLGSATPPVECVVLLTIIMASGAEVATQMVAVVAFTLLVLALVEIPLITYLVMPRKTEAVMLRLNGRLNVHGRRIFQTMLAVSAIVLVVSGMANV